MEAAVLDHFTRHPRAIGETWSEHLATAWSFAGPLALATGACLIHGVFPFLCERTASRTITALHARLGRRIAASAEAPAARPPEFAATAGS
jgi:hypothetical protein